MKRHYIVDYIQEDVLLHTLKIKANKTLYTAKQELSEDDFYLNLINVAVQVFQSRDNAELMSGDVIKITDWNEYEYTFILDDQNIETFKQAFLMVSENKGVVKSIESSSPIPYKMLSEFNELSANGKLFWLYCSFTPATALEILTYWYDGLDKDHLSENFEQYYAEVLEKVKSWEKTYRETDSDVENMKHGMVYARLVQAWGAYGEAISKKLCKRGQKAANLGLIDMMEWVISEDMLECLDKEVQDLIIENFPKTKEIVVNYYTPKRVK